MQYIILDLEWNQPLNFESKVFKKIGDKLLFEMIQIGAVKLDESLQICDTISIPIRPQYYVQIHPRIRKMTHLDEETLSTALTFNDAMDQFISWCGEDYALMTWGCDDVSVLKQNMDFFQYSAKLPPLCDLQRLFSVNYKRKDRMGLKAAMELLGIEPDENLHFHDALHDSYYTAQVFARMPNPSDVLKYPQAPRPLGHQKKVHRSHIRGGCYETLELALNSEEAQSPLCPACGKPLTMEEGGYVRQSPMHYLHLGRCKSHGLLLTRLRVSETDEGLLVRMSVTKASPMDSAYVHTKRLQISERKA